MSYSERLYTCGSLGLLLVTLLACKSFAKRSEESTVSPPATESDEPSAASADDPPATADTATAAATAAPGSSGATKTAKRPLVVPSPTTDRFGRNRDKDGPCPKGFVEQPGVEQYSSCARACTGDATCHGHTCVDSDVGDGKVCSDIAIKTAAAPAAGTRGAACKVSADCATPWKCLSPQSSQVELTCQKTCRAGSDCGDDEKCLSSLFTGPGAPDICQTIAYPRGEVMVDLDGSGSHECAKPCKSDDGCEESWRPRQCTPGSTRLKPRGPVSVCRPL